MWVWFRCLALYRASRDSVRRFGQSKQEGEAAHIRQFVQGDHHLGCWHLVEYGPSGEAVTPKYVAECCSVVLDGCGEMAGVWSDVSGGGSVVFGEVRVGAETH